MTTATTHHVPAGGPAAAPRTLPDRLLGLLGGAMILAALVLLVFGGEGDTGAGPATAAPPALAVVAPQDGAELGRELAIEFRAGRELVQQPGGWGVDDLHLHLELDGTQFMPGPADIRRLSAGTYRWLLPAPAAGEHTLRLFWSGPDHRPIAEGASEPVRFRIAG